MCVCVCVCVNCVIQESLFSASNVNVKCVYVGECFYTISLCMYVNYVFRKVFFFFAPNVNVKCVYVVACFLLFLSLSLSFLSFTLSLSLYKLCHKLFTL